MRIYWAALLAALYCSGCVIARTVCDYSPDGGQLVRSYSKSAVLGKGDVDNVVESCGTLAHESHATGLDQGTTDAIRAIVTIAPAAAAAATVERGIDAVDN